MRSKPKVISQRYEIVREVGKSNLGVSYKALDRKFNRFVTAISIHPFLITESETIISLDKRVSRFLMLDHDNIACVFDCEKGKGTFLLVEEWIDGPNLRQILFRLRERGSTMPHKLACFVAWRICKAIEYAYNKKASPSGKPINVVHGDIQPSNIMISLKGGIKLTDFGIMQSIVEHRTDTTVTSLSYKTAYLSPEIVHEEAPIHQSDIFSLGVVLWESLTGESPFAGRTHVETLKNIMSGNYRKELLAESEVPEDLQQLLQKAIDTDKEKRYQTAGTMAGEIRSVLKDEKDSNLTSELGEWVSELFQDELEKENDWSIISADLWQQVSKHQTRREPGETGIEAPPQDISEEPGEYSLEELKATEEFEELEKKYLKAKHLKEMEKALRKGNREEALKNLEEVYKLDPTDSRIRRNYDSLKKEIEAIKHFKKAQDIENHDVKKAIEEVEEALSLQPQNVEFQKKLKSLKQKVHVEEIITRANAVLSEGDRKKALEQFTLALELKPSLSEIKKQIDNLKLEIEVEQHTKKAELAYEGGELDEAISELLSAAEMAPQNEDIQQKLKKIKQEKHIASGKQYLEQGDLAVALIELQEALEYTPEDARLKSDVEELRNKIKSENLLLKADRCCREGKSDEALDLYRKALSMKPQDEEIQTKIAELEIETRTSHLLSVAKENEKEGEIRKAKEAVKEIFEFNPYPDREVESRLKQLMERYLHELMKEEGEVRRHYDAACEASQKGNHKSADRYLDRAIEAADPANKELRKELKIWKEEMIGEEESVPVAEEKPAPPVKKEVAEEVREKPVRKTAVKKKSPRRRSRAIVFVSLGVVVTVGAFAVFYAKRSPRIQHQGIPLPSAPGSLILNCSVESCEVIVYREGEEQPMYQGLLPIDTLRLPPGAYDLSTSKSGYNTVEESITISSDHVSNKVLTVTAILHDVTITANKPGAAVYVDDRSAGSAPVTEALGIGDHKFRVVWQGKSMNKNLTLLSEQSDTTLNFVFREKKEEFGQLKVSGRTWADVWVDGRKLGTQAPCNIRLTTGRHVIKLVNPTIGTTTKTVVIRQGKTTTIKI